jgi:cytoskeletal protein CcmA (bactofilin family)
VSVNGSGRPPGEKGILVVTEDTIIQGIGELYNCRQLEVYGYIEGQMTAGAVRVHKTGRCYGTVKTDAAEVHGDLQGTVFVKNLIDIRSSGSVSGNVHYGKLALEAGGNLSAEVRNVPPTIAGDLDLAVGKGRSVRITLQDLTALDPDDDARDLIFTVSNARNGSVTFAGMPTRAVIRFTQADLAGGKVLFTHDGTDTRAASFDVVVADHAGATSGAPQTVKVAVAA